MNFDLIIDLTTLSFKNTETTVASAVEPEAIDINTVFFADQTGQSLPY